MEDPIKKFLLKNFRINCVIICAFVGGFLGHIITKLILG